MTNRSIVKFRDGREICLSYGVPVAAFIPADFCSGCESLGRKKHTEYSGYVRTDRKYSPTTSKHANGYAGRDSAIVPAEEFDRLVDPLEVKA